MNKQVTKIKEDTAQSESGAIISMIERAATNPDVDIDKMERLLQMQQTIVDREAKQEFVRALAKAKSEMPAVLKNKENKTTNSTYSDLEAIALAIDPIIAENGFTTSFGSDVSPMDGHYRVTCELDHIGGHSRNYHADVPADNAGMKGTKNKTDTHAFGSTMSYGRRYLKCLVFDLALSDDDGNAAGAGAVITDKQREHLQSMIDETGADIASFCKYMKIQSLNQMPLSKYGQAENSLLAKKAKQ